MRGLLAIVLAAAALCQCQKHTNAEELPFKCDKEQDAFYPHPEDCQAFYHCENGEAKLKICDKDLAYNPRRQQCDLKENAGCEPGLYASVEPDNTGELVKYPPSHVVCTSPNCRCMFENDDCSETYYECRRMSVYLMRCPSPLKFNTEKFLCDKPENIKGCSRVCPRDRIPHECTCVRSYDTCCDGQMVPMKCPAGTAFNLASRECDSLTFRSSCGGEGGSCSTCDGQKFAHESDCRAYYVCNGKNVLTLLRCPDGTAFSKSRRTCDVAAVRGECGDTTKPDTNGCGKYCIHDGEYPHPTHCRRWCHCSNGIFHEKTCPGATHFSVAHNRCESPGLAACGLADQWSE